jgi:DNA-binding MarR family transcriptional regulator
VQRVSDRIDRRQVQVHLTAAGARAVGRVAALHRAELLALTSVFRIAQLSAFNDRE